MRNQYLHKAWTGSAWYPSVTEWLDLGGNFSSAPATVSWGPNRLDIFGIDAVTGGIMHKYWDGQAWAAWEELGGGPFRGSPLATSWGEGRFNVWVASNDDGQLHHLFWDGSAYQGWEALGGHFLTAPAVVHWDVGKIDIVGLFDAGDEANYHSKSFDGSQWNPSFDGWWDKGGNFAGQPAVVVNKGKNFLYVLGIGTAGELKLNIWDGFAWQPSPVEYWDLGDTRNPYENVRAGQLEL